MSSQESVTLTSLFQKSGTALRVYDLGRRLRRLSNDEFERIEALKTPYPTPYLHHAFIALMLWNPGSPDQNAVWFLKLPLDEQGFMIPAVRDDILNRLLTNVQSSENGVPQEDSLKDNPFMFKPSDEKMAVFHARAARDAGESVSIHYEAVEQFINGQQDDWTNLSLQGLADYVIHMENGPSESALAERLESLPEGFLAQLLGLLEHAQIGDSLSDALINMLAESLTNNTPEPLKVALLIRALSGSEDPSRLQLAVEAVLNTETGLNIEVLSAIATRAEAALMAPSVLKNFLERLANSEAGQSGFSRILAELMYLPIHRVLIVQTLRQSNISATLAQATDQMFGSGFRQLN